MTSITALIFKLEAAGFVPVSDTVFSSRLPKSTKPSFLSGIREMAIDSANDDRAVFEDARFVIEFERNAPNLVVLGTFLSKLIATIVLIRQSRHPRAKMPGGQRARFESAV